MNTTQISKRLAYIITKFNQEYEIVGPHGTTWNKPDPTVLRVTRTEIRKKLNEWLKEKDFYLLTQMCDDWQSFSRRVIESNGATKNGDVFLLVKQ